MTLGSEDARSLTMIFSPNQIAAFVQGVVDDSVVGLQEDVKVMKGWCDHNNSFLVDKSYSYVFFTSSIPVGVNVFVCL